MVFCGSQKVGPWSAFRPEHMGSRRTFWSLSLAAGSQMGRGRMAVHCPTAWPAGLWTMLHLTSRGKLVAKAGHKAFGEKEETNAFLYVHLLNKNSFMTIQYSLVISIEKITSLYIQKYRFEQYENNQDKYHEKLVLQRKVGRLRAV